MSFRKERNRPVRTNLLSISPKITKWKKTHANFALETKNTEQTSCLSHAHAKVLVPKSTHSVSNIGCRSRSKKKWNQRMSILSLSNSFPAKFANSLCPCSSKRTEWSLTFCPFIPEVQKLHRFGIVVLQNEIFYSHSQRPFAGNPNRPKFRLRSSHRKRQYLEFSFADQRRKQQILHFWFELEIRHEDQTGARQSRSLCLQRAKRYSNRRHLGQCQGHRARRKIRITWRKTVRTMIIWKQFDHTLRKRFICSLRSSQFVDTHIHTFTYLCFRSFYSLTLNFCIYTVKAHL